MAQNSHSIWKPRQKIVRIGYYDLKFQSEVWEANKSILQWKPNV